MRATTGLIALFLLGCGGPQPAPAPAPLPPVVASPPPRSAGPPGPVQEVYVAPVTAPTTVAPAARSTP